MKKYIVIRVVTTLDYNEYKDETYIDEFDEEPKANEWYESIVLGEKNFYTSGPNGDDNPNHYWVVSEKKKGMIEKQESMKLSQIDKRFGMH